MGSRTGLRVSAVLSHAAITSRTPARAVDAAPSPSSLDLRQGPFIARDSSPGTIRVAQRHDGHCRRSAVTAPSDQLVVAAVVTTRCDPRLLLAWLGRSFDFLRSTSPEPSTGHAVSGCARCLCFGGGSPHPPRHDQRCALTLAITARTPPRADHASRSVSTRACTACGGTEAAQRSDTAAPSRFPPFRPLDLAPARLAPAARHDSLTTHAPVLRLRGLHESLHSNTRSLSSRSSPPLSSPAQTISGYIASLFILTVRLLGRSTASSSAFALLRANLPNASSSSTNDDGVPRRTDKTRSCQLTKRVLLSLELPNCARTHDGTSTLKRDRFPLDSVRRFGLAFARSEGCCCGRTYWHSFGRAGVQLPTRATTRRMARTFRRGLARAKRHSRALRLVL